MPLKVLFVLFLFLSLSELSMSLSQKHSCSIWLLHGTQQSQGNAGVKKNKLLIGNTDPESDCVHMSTNREWLMLHSYFHGFYYGALP
jgi:hypothetical protein